MGKQPCDKDGVEIVQIKNAETAKELDKGLRIDRTFFQLDLQNPLRIIMKNSPATFEFVTIPAKAIIQALLLRPLRHISLRK